MTGDGDWSTVRDFTTKIERPAQVSLSSPSDDLAVWCSTTLSWSSSTRSTEYMQVSTDSSTIHLNLLWLEKIYHQIHMKLRIYSIMGWIILAGEGVEYDGDGDWSTVWNFKTDFRPNLESPINGSIIISTTAKS